MKFYQLPNSNLFTHGLLFFLREATSETYGPRVYTLSYLLSDLFFAFEIYFFAFIFRSIIPKTLKYFVALYFICDLFIQSITTILPSCTNFWHRYPKGINNPFNMSVARICYLCAGAIYVVLLGSPTGSITLVSYLREIPTADVLHHPFLFWEIPT